MKSMDDFKKELEDYFCRFTFGQFVTLILLEIVTLFFVFYLGARYGSDLMGHRSSVANQQESELPKENPKSVDDIVGTPPLEYTYPDVLTGKEGEKGVRVKPSGMTAAEYEKQAKQNEPKEAPVAKSEPKVEAKREVKEVSPPKTVDQPVNEGEELAPEKEAKPSAIENEAPKVSTKAPKGKFTIQVASFPSAEEASTGVSKWKGRGYSAYMTVGEIPNKGVWYRVRIGGFKTQPEAKKFLEKLKRKEKTNGLVVLSKS